MRRYILCILTVVFLFYYPFGLGAAEITGTWTTSEGEMSFAQQGNQITGSYSSEHGEITGTM